MLLDAGYVPQKHQHRVSSEHHRRSYEAVVIVMRYELAKRLEYGFLRQSVSNHLRSKGLDNAEQAWKVRGLLHIARHVEEIWDVVHEMEKARLATDEDYTKFRCGQILKKVLWDMTKLEGCPSILPTLRLETSLNENKVVCLSKEGKPEIWTRIKFVNMLISDVERFSDIYEELKKRRQQALLGEVEQMMTCIKLRAKSIGGIPGGVDDTELLEQLKESWIGEQDVGAIGIPLKESPIIEQMIEEEEEAEEEGRRMDREKDETLSVSDNSVVSVDVEMMEREGKDGSTTGLVLESGLLHEVVKEFQKGRKVSFASTAAPESPRRADSLTRMDS